MSFSTQKAMFQQPGVVAIWDTFQATLSREFVALVEEIRGEESGRGDQ